MLRSMRTLFAAAQMRTATPSPSVRRFLATSRSPLSYEDQQPTYAPRPYGPRSFQNFAPSEGNQYSAKPTQAAPSSAKESSPAPTSSGSSYSRSEYNSAATAFSFPSTSNNAAIYANIPQEGFSSEISSVLTEQLDESIVEILPEGMIYVPVVHYRRQLNKAFGPGGWFLCPVSDHIQKDKFLYREFALFCNGRIVSQVVGEHTINDSNSSFASNAESCKSNAITRASKDLGIFADLHDPSYAEQWKKRFAERVLCEHMRTKERRYLWKRTNRFFSYPWQDPRGKGQSE
eukprot:TRINITY_DN535_c0_g6_i1.p1 TRINITY_DN535_c0_g6~~TRINITY_DN535_c0_g6_i1.p1  ORF type:complete len:289 (-),score=57.41 TRINITY_DN535_c0_g6_i1:450-1316(-)